MKSTKSSRKLIATWSDDIVVGIYNSTWTVRLYADRAVVRIPYVKWVGNTGGYAERHERITGKLHAELLEIKRQETEDDVDYTGRVARLVIYTEQY